MTLIRISAVVNNTESPSKVSTAITKIFGEIELNVDENLITSELNGMDSLHVFRTRIASDKIKATLNKVLTRWVDEDRLSFGLNRQAALAGHVSINLQNEDPMGPIQVTIEGDVAEVVTFLTA